MKKDMVYRVYDKNGKYMFSTKNINTKIVAERRGYTVKKEKFEVFNW